MPMWNMSRKGLEELYEKLPSPKPDFDEAWRLTGGNPRMLSQLYEAEWDVERVVEGFIRAKGLRDMMRRWRDCLKKVVEDPDNLFQEDFPKELKDELIAKNLIVYDVYPREAKFWIDEPPPERDAELGIGRDVAWQSPLHREAVKRAME